MSTSTAVQTRKNIMEGSSPQLHARLTPCNGKKYIFELGGSCEDGDLCYVDKDATRVFLFCQYRGPVRMGTYAMYIKMQPECFYLFCIEDC